MTLADVKETIVISLDQLRANKLRSGLTVLGIVIGVLTVIIMSSVINGLNGQVNGIISGLVGAPIGQKSWATATQTCLYSFAPHRQPRGRSRNNPFGFGQRRLFTNAVLPVDGGV